MTIFLYLLGYDSITKSTKECEFMLLDSFLCCSATFLKFYKLQTYYNFCLIGCDNYSSNADYENSTGKSKINMISNKYSSSLLVL